MASGGIWKGMDIFSPFCDSPLDNETVGENVYLNIINRAKRYVYICTPYLVIDNEMMTALCLADKKWCGCPSDDTWDSRQKTGISSYPVLL